MMKRFANNNHDETKNKKPKINENVDDLWDDDLDEKALDDCFYLAMQSSQQSDISILPSYNALFRQKTENKFTSTQFHPTQNFPSTSKLTNRIRVDGDNYVNETVHDPGLETKIKKLEEQFIAKEGEIAILRARLNDIQTRNEQEQAKKQSEFSEKITVLEKNLTTAKSELEFKHFEIVNLKQKVAQILKSSYAERNLNATRNISISTEPASSQIKDVVSSKVPCINSLQGDFKLAPILQLKFPLQKAIPSSVFYFTKNEKYLVNLTYAGMTRNTILFLNDQMSQTLVDRLIRVQPKDTIVDDGRPLQMNYIHYEMAELMKCSTQQLQHQNNQIYINKILCISEQLLHNLHGFLLDLKRETLETNMTNNVISLKNRLQLMNLELSIFNARHWCPEELGVNVRQSMGLVAEILPYSSYLQGYVLSNKNLIFYDEEGYLKYLPAIESKLHQNYSNNFDYLQLILAIVRLIRKLKNASHFPGFLSAVVTLLNKIGACSGYQESELNNLVNEIIREIVFLSPDAVVLSNLMAFMKDASASSVFVERLCKMSPKDALQIKKTVLYFDEDVCVLRILCILFKYSLLQIKESSSSSSVLMLYLNIMNFLLNCIKCKCTWLYYREGKYCDCLYKIIELSTYVVYETIKKFCNIVDQGKSIDKPSILSDCIKSGIKLMHLLNFKVRYSFINPIFTISQWQVIISSLLENQEDANLTETDVQILEELNTFDEMVTQLPEVTSKMTPRQSILWK